MDIEIIHDEVPTVGGGVGFNRAFDVVEVILFGAGRARRDEVHLSGNDIKVDDEGQRPMPNILIFATLHLARS